jgi:TonB-dependent starch-binding outer membrane protein SusC
MTKFYLSFSRYLTALLFLVTTVAWSQSRTVTGKVTSADDGSGLPGVNVVEKGTNNGTVTDVDGNFSVNVADNATLVFSFVGYASQEVVVGSQSTININLASDVRSLNEVVVVGYGTQEKKEITSAVASVKAEDFNRGTVNDPAQLLQGKVAGLNISRAGGDPNGGFTIRLRGVTSFQNQDPLIVIDGIIGGSLSTVDPNDIASIDVLKDGSAAAIYGTRGSSGVILITTKSGKPGKTTVEYNGSAAVESIARTMPFMTADEYRQVPGANDLGADTDWLDEVSRKGFTHVHNLSLSGGTQSTTYRASFNLRDVNGILLNSGFTQINGRFNLTQKALNDKLSVNINLATTSRESSYGDVSAFRYAIIANPTMPIYDNTFPGDGSGSGNPGGQFGGYAQVDAFDVFNPLAIAKQTKNEGRDNRLLTSIRADYDLIKDLRVGVFFARTWETDLRGYYSPKNAKFGGGFGANGLARSQNNSRYNDLYETTLNYDKAFGDLNMTALAGYSYQNFFNVNNSIQVRNLLTNEFTYYTPRNAPLSLSEGMTQDDRNNTYNLADGNELQAFFGRLNFNLKETYFLSASARYEGSSRNGPNNKYGLFPAVSAGVTLSNLFELPAVNALKLRASWGVTGAQPAGSYLSFLRFGPQGNFLYQGNYTPSYGPVSNPNKDLQWETKNEVNFGLDATMLDGKLSGSADYYIRNVSDLLLTVNVPVPPNLYSSTLLNIGELKSTGFELAVNYNAISNTDFNWTTGINFATNKTVVESLTSGENSFGNEGVAYFAGVGSPGQNDYRITRVKQGEELGQFYSWVQSGISDTGEPVFENLNGDLNADGTPKIDELDKKVIGQGLPNFTLGWTNTFTFKRFDLNFFMRGAFGHDIMNSYRTFYENTGAASSYNVVKTKYYDPTLKVAKYNSSHIEKGDFVKMDNITLGYTAPLSAGTAVNRLRVYFTAQNPFVITGYTGIDPEVRYGDAEDNNNAFSPGIERRSTYFTTRTFTLGVNVGF